MRTFSISGLMEGFRDYLVLAFANNDLHSIRVNLVLVFALLVMPTTTLGHSLVAHTLV